MSGGGGQTQTSTANQGGTSQSQSSWMPNQAALPGYGFIAGNAMDLMQKPVPYFPGQTYVGPSQGTQEGVNMAMGGVPYYQQGAETLAGGAAPGYQAAAGMVPGAIQGQQGINQTSLGNYNFLSGAADVRNNPYVQGMMKQNEQSATDWLQKQALPSLQNAGVRANALGSGRLGLAQGTAAAEAQKNLLAQNAQTQMSAYQQGLGAQQSALGMTGNMLQNQMAPGMAQAWGAQQQQNAANALQGAGQMMGAGGQQALNAGQTVEDYQARALQDAMNRFAYQYQEPYQRMQNLGQALGFLQPLGTSYGSGVQTGTGSQTQANPNQKSPWASALGGAASGAAMGSAFGPWGTVIGGGIGALGSLL